MEDKQLAELISYSANLSFELVKKFHKDSPKMKKMTLAESAHIHGFLNGFRLATEMQEAKEQAVKE